MASVVHRFLTAACLVFVLAQPARAWSSEDLRRMQSGDIVVSTTARPHGGIVDAGILIEAPPRLVYTLLADPKRSPDYSPGITAVQVLEDQGTHKRVRLKVSVMGLINEEQELSSTYTPYESIAWQQTKGRFRSQYGQYRISPLGTGTILTYHLEIDTGTALPAFVVNFFVRGSVPDLLRNIRKQLVNS